MGKRTQLEVGSWFPSGSGDWQYWVAEGYCP
jgi:hypothetical protein